MNEGLTKHKCCGRIRDLPDAVENEEQLNEDASEWQNSSHDDARQWANVKRLLRDLTRDLIGAHWVIDRLMGHIERRIAFL